MKKKKIFKQLSIIAGILLFWLIVIWPGLLKAVESPVKGLNVIQENKQLKAVSAESTNIVPIDEADPMYWIGGTGGDKDVNRAMIWMGQWEQKEAGSKDPILWRCVRSDGQGPFGHGLLLTTEHMLFQANGAYSGDGDWNWENYNNRLPWNGDAFYNPAFNDVEKQWITPTSVDGTEGDKVFVLSKSEYDNALYFGSNIWTGEKTPYLATYRDADKTFTRSNDGVGYYTQFCWNYDESGKMNGTIWWQRSPASNVRCVQMATRIDPNKVLFVPVMDAGLSERTGKNASLKGVGHTDPSQYNKVDLDGNGYGTGNVGIKLVNRGGCTDELEWDTGGLSYNTIDTIVKGYNPTGSEIAGKKYIYCSMFVDTNTGEKKVSASSGESGAYGANSIPIPDGWSKNGVQYFTWIYSSANNTTSNVLHINYVNGAWKSQTDGPKIVTQPSNLSCSAGSNVTLTVNASGTGPLTYQWYVRENKEGAETKLVGTTSTPSYSYKTGSDANGPNYIYSCRVFDSQGFRVNSNEAAISFNRNATALTAPAQTDPMYWMGQGAKGGQDNNRAMVWMGNFWHNDAASKTPVLWRTLRSDGTGDAAYKNGILMMTEHGISSMPRSSDGNESYYVNMIREYLNGLGSDALDVRQQVSASWDREFHKPGANKDDKTESVYEAGFSAEEQEMIAHTSLEGQVNDKLFLFNSGDTSNGIYMGNGADGPAFMPRLDINSHSLWWTRPGTNFWHEAYGSTGVVGGTASSYGIRPGMVLNPAKTAFVASNNTGTAGPSVSTTLPVVNGTAHKLDTEFNTHTGSLRAFSKGIAAGSVTVAASETANNVSTLSWSGVTDTANSYIGAMVVNTETRQKWVGRVAKASAATGNVKITLPSNSPRANHRIFAWVENESLKGTGASATKEMKNVYYPPTISKQPTAVTGKTGTNVNMTVTASGDDVTGGLSYEWYTTSATTAASGTKVGTTTTGTFSYKLTNADNGKKYYCIIKNSSNQSVTSAVAAMTVYYPPTVKTNPSNAAVKQGAQATFTVAGQGGNPTAYTYQWQYRTSSSGSWANVTNTQGTGWNTATLKTVASTAAMNGWQFQCYIGNAQYAAASGTGALTSAATLTVYYPPTVKTNPSNTSVKQGAQATFTVAGQGGNPTAYTYQWQYRTSSSGTWANVTNTQGTGWNTATLKTVASTAAMNGWQFQCYIGNAQYAAASGTGALTSAATLTVYYPPTVKTNPSNTSVKQGAQATFTVAGQGGNPTAYTYQWQYRTSSSGSWANVTNTQGTGWNTATLKTVASTAAMNGWQFQCYIGNAQYAAASGTGALSSAATLTVYYPPTIKTHPSSQTQTVGANATFTVAGQGGNPTAYTYLWQYSTNNGSSWANVTSTVGTGETTATLTVPVTAAKNGYRFRCYVGNNQYTGTAGAVSNGAAALTAQYQVTYNQNYSGAPANTSVKVNTGSAVVLPTYTRNGYEFQGWATTNNATTANAGKGGASYTPTANITLYGVWKQYVKPVLNTTLPADAKVSQGKNTTFSTGITTAGYPATYTYQWYYKDGTNTEKAISGATGATYTLDKIPAASNGYKYYCKISHAATNTTQTTREALLTVYNTPPTPGITYLNGANPYPWSNSTDGQAFIPTKGTLAVGGTTLQYQVSGGAWKEFTGTKVVTVTKDGVQETNPASGESARIVVKQEGQNVVKVRSINTADNDLASSAVDVTTKLDYTAPTAKLNDGKGTIWDQLHNLVTFGKFYKENVVFTITDIKDDPASGVAASSGIKKTSYYINEAKTEAEETELKSITAANIAEKSASWTWQTYTSGSSFTVSPDKKFVVYVKVEDNAGNLHFIGSDGLVADATNPTATVAQNPTEWTNKDVTLTTTAADATAGLEAKPYSYDGGKTFVSANTNAYGSNGEKAIQVKDKSGNVLSTTYTITNIDKQKPVISDTPNIQVKPDWVTGSGESGKVTISLLSSAVSDNEVSGDTTVNKGKSGIAGVYLVKEANKADETVPADAIAGQFTESGEGDAKVYSIEITSPSATTSYYIRTKDNAGNWSVAADAHKATVKVDTVEPKAGKAEADPSDWTNKTVTIAASDIKIGSSGVDSVYLFKDDKETEKTSGYPLTVSADESSYTLSIPSAELTKADCEGEKTWYVRVYNKAGVIGDPVSVTTKYDETKAELSAVQNPDKDKDGAVIYTKEKSIEITAKDTISGLAKVTAYKKDTEGTGQAGGEAGEEPQEQQAETLLWPKNEGETAGTTEEVKTSVVNIQENCTYVIKAYDRAGNVTEQEAEVTGVDRTAPDITGFKKHTEKIDGSKKMIVTFKVKDEGSGIEKVVYGTDNALDLSTATEATAGDIDGNQEAGEGYYWYHFTLPIKEAEVNYNVRASDALNNQSETIAAYEAEDLIDVTVPAKMMFAVVPELDAARDAHFLSPAYQVRNNNTSTRIEVGLSQFSPTEGGKITLIDGEAANADELNLKAGQGTGAFIGLTEDKPLFNLAAGSNPAEIPFGILNPGGSEGDTGSFTYTANVFDYQKAGLLKQDPILRSRYTAGLHFSIYLPKN